MSQNDDPVSVSVCIRACVCMCERKDALDSLICVEYFYINCHIFS